jgi:hypothetical protein
MDGTSVQSNTIKNCVPRSANAACPIYRISSPPPLAAISAKLSPDDIPYSEGRMARDPHILWYVLCESVSWLVFPIYPPNRTNSAIITSDH